MKINGMEAKHIGLVGFTRPWEAAEMEMFDDVWGTPDGKRYVERYIQVDVVEYDWLKHGYIWTNEEINSHKKATILYNGVDYEGYPVYSDERLEDCIQHETCEFDDYTDIWADE